MACGVPLLGWSFLNLPATGGGRYWVGAPGLSLGDQELAGEGVPQCCGKLQSHARPAATGRASPRPPQLRNASDNLAFNLSS